MSHTHVELSGVHAVERGTLEARLEGLTSSATEITPARSPTQVQPYHHTAVTVEAAVESCYAVTAACRKLRRDVLLVEIPLSAFA